MFEPLPENRRPIDAVLGFLLGVVLSLAIWICFAFLGSVLAFPTDRIAVLDGLALLIAGVVALRMRQSGYAQGLLVAVSIAFLLNGIWGVALSN